MGWISPPNFHFYNNDVGHDHHVQSHQHQNSETDHQGALSCLHWNPICKTPHWQSQVSHYEHHHWNPLKDGVLLAPSGAFHMPMRNNRSGRSSNPYLEFLTQQLNATIFVWQIAPTMLRCGSYIAKNPMQFFILIIQFRENIFIGNLLLKVTINR